jgi:hypothetical protein
MKIGITLLERIIFEIDYFTKTKKHLEGTTLCSGSRRLNGFDVPIVHMMDLPDQNTTPNSLYTYFLISWCGFIDFYQDGGVLSVIAA